MNASTGSNDTTKFWAILTMMLLAVAITVTLIDLGIKAAILAESNSMKLAMEEWEVRYGQKVSGRTDTGNSSDGTLNGRISGDVLAANDAGLEAGNASNGIAKSTRPSARNRNVVRPSDGD
jgi:hypothetical protein